MSASYAVASYGGAPSATEQVTVTNSTGQGDAVIVLVGAGSAGVVSSVTDSQGNTYNLIASNSAQSIGLFAYQAFTNNRLIAGTDWIKVTYTGATTGQQWIARGMPGVSGFDVSAVANSPSSGSIGTTTGSPSQAQEWAIALIASGNASGTGNAPTSFTGGFTAQQTVQNGSGAFYTFADQVTTNTNPLQPGATLAPANKWELIVLSMKFTPVFKIGSANSTGTGSSLSIPVTTPTQPGNAIVVFAEQTSATVTSVTDSTLGNVYTIQQSNTGNTFDVTTLTAQGITQLGAAYSTASYSGSGNTLTAAQELDTWLNGGGANWPTHKLSPRTMAFNVLREYYATDPLMSSTTGWPTSSGSDTHNLATRASDGVQNVCITFRPARDGTNNYTSGTYTTEKANLVSAITYIKSLFPKAKFCLWHEANINGVHGPFGDGSQVTGLGSPYGSGVGTVTTAQMHANWAAYVGFYGPAFQAAGVDLYWVNSMASPGEAVDFFDIALNNTQRGYFTGIASDCYTGNFINSSDGSIKNTLTQGYGTNNLSLLGLAAKYNLPTSIWELGAGTGQAATHNVTFLDQCITQPLVNWLAQGNPIAEVLWFNYGGDVIGSAMDPSVLAALQRCYDALQNTTCALQSGDSITVNWSAGANTKFAVAAGLALATTGLPDQKVTAAGTSAAPSATTGALAQANEVVLAYCSDANAGGNIAWAGGWNVLATDQTGSSTFQSLAYQQVASTSAVTASGTIVSAAWDLNVISFPVTSVALTSGMVIPKPKIASTGSVATSSITGTGGMQIPKPRISSGGIGAPNVPYVIGSVQTSGTSATIPVTTSVNNGDSIQVGVVLASTVSSSTIGPDTQGNVYTLVLASAGHNDSTFVVYQCDGANPLTQGVDSIPISQTVSGPLGGLAIGDNSVFGADQVSGAVGTSTAPNSNATATLTQAEEHVFGWIANAQAGGTPTWGSGLAALGSIDVATTTFLSVGYKAVTSTSPVTASGTIVSADWGCGVLTNKVIPISVTLIPSNGVVGVPYLQTLESSGGQQPTTYSIPSGSLPPGITLSSGVMSGIPTTAGSYTYTLRATDSLGITFDQVVTVIIRSGATGAAAMSAIPNNLFTPPDADFETQGWTWGSVSNNAAPPFNTQGIAFTGSWCLGWQSLSDGPTSIAAGAFPVKPNSPYILSGALSPAQSTTAEVGITWYDANNNVINTQFGASSIVTGAQWCPLAANFTSPANAVTATPVVQVDDSNAGDTNFIDMMFFAQSAAQVLVDWTNGPFQPGSLAGNAFMDVSPWLRLDENGITYQRGRQDAISEIAAGSGSFELQNDLGQFARDSSVSLPAAFGGAMTLKRRAKISFADEHGVWYTRFDGNVSEVDYTFDNIGSASVALVNLTDVLDDLGRQDPLFCWTKEQILSDGPLYHWSLDDGGTSAASSTSGSGVAGETSGNNGPPMRLVLSDSSGTATIAWQDTSGGVETLADAASATGQDGSAFWSAGSNQPNNPLRGLVSGKVGPFTTPIGSVLLNPKQTPQSAQNTFIGGTGYMLTTELPTPIAPTATGSDYSIELWMMPDTSLVTGLALNNGPYIALGLGSGTTKTNLLAGIFLNSGAATFKCQTYSQPPSFLGLNFPGSAAPTAISSTSAAFVPDSVKRPHHIVITIQGDPSAAQLTLWLDGNQVGSGFTLPAGQTYDTICIGGAYGGCGAFIGNLSLASVYPFLLSADQITQHCQMGQYGMWENTTDDCIAQIATFANVPVFWSSLTAQHASLSLTDYMDINGSNALSSMQQYEAAEHGLLFVAADGSLQFHARNWRMGYGAPNLYLAEDLFDATNLQYKVVSQFLCNEEGIAGPNTGGANSTTLLVNQASGPGRTETQTTASSVIQSGFVNTASQRQYGVYASSPVSSPLTLPLISWSRGYAALGLPASSYWADPNLSDRAAWDANSRAEPWALPASVSIDLLTLNPNTGLGISDFYNLEIDNVIAPASNMLPPSFPDAQTSVEWFIEGVTETYTSDARHIEFYTSPAEPQRAWIPGDSVYGVLGTTAKLGVSTADLNTVAAFGKDVSHDAGGPYWPPNFNVRMNAPAVQPGGLLPPPMGGFVGAADIRGIAQNLQMKLQPPMCVVGSVSQTQSFTNGALTGSSPPNIATLFWDQVFVDTTGGMGAIPGWPNWYLVTTPGYYEIDASVVWGTTGAQVGYTGQGWIIVAQAAAQALAAGTGTPLTVNQYVRPIGEAVGFNSANVNPVCAPSTRMYLGVGDMVAVGAEQNFTAARNMGTGLGGSRMSLRLVGIATNDDRTLINTSLGSGGSVSLTSKGTLQQANFFNTHTYSYQGKNGGTPYARLFVGSVCLQGDNGGKNNGWGSRTSQIAFNVANIASTLSGHTILSATVTAQNVSSFYQNGARLLLGWTTDTPGQSKFNAQDHNTDSWVTSEWFQANATKTFSIPIVIASALNTGGAKALVLGNSTNDSDPGNYGSWLGGPSSWTLTVNYV